jgi:hypothetical protein
MKGARHQLAPIVAVGNVIDGSASIFLALERSLQPPHLVGVAFDHLRPRPNQMV